MAIVVESTFTSAAPGSATTTVVLTKPTGLAVGELLVSILTSWDLSGGANSGTWSTLSGWTSATSNTGTQSVVMSIQYKVATAGDVAAADFTFTHTTSEYMRGTILRCSGNNAVDGGLGTTDSYNNNAASSTAFSRSITPYTPPENGSLVIMQTNGDTDSTAAYTTSGQTVVNTSFTEAWDAAYTSGGVNATAYGIQSTAAEISVYSATFSSSMARHHGQLAVFNPPVSASGSNTLVTTTTTTFAQTGTCDTTGATTLATATAESLTQSGQGTTPTQWNHETKESTTWNNDAL